MASFQTLPVEVLVQILRYVNHSGDLGNLRLCSSDFMELSVQQERLFWTELCSDEEIVPRTTSLPRCEDSTAGILQVMAAGNFLREMRVISSDRDGKIQHLTESNRPHSELGRWSGFVLFDAVHQLLKASTTVTNSQGGVLAPSADGDTSTYQVLSEECVRFLKTEMTLQELEAVIAAINVCTTRLWSMVFLFTPQDLTVGSFGSLSGSSFNMEQAILTEHVIWKGPQWVSRVLEGFGQTNRRSGPELHRNADMTLLREGIWRGTREEGARLAANGLARLLWKERQEKIENKAHSSGTAVAITDMRVNSMVWRGPSGDM
ncbi:hypothetical protein LTR99_001109 [Exophiala xenobiotica]|uniref:F-box domain-containing protein n=1 Tax=Vermiconidia calcicola TaxID=1690605 RepID=A0AAV9QKJ1_9PEZI|nr:hypothetical protein LTR92_001541 [Exophiala xenobiotica]KAK5545671.1 hypothetical protein LTR25_000679 [Vermiconidia calcicola]KAK5550069.1 hypothetical protein LTR23_000362 [Chaetothyriales sp. CCFEE 6169]KAK5229947.1 hypothetical protein LTR72_001481 [Exophiala xenobiotica]KAK5271734.1 hypothetical protein LTR96_003561 [Exophiala xenobiotica]